ncbi:MAG: hypothetical protein NZ608_07480 [candidate division WOR-3 bacterium]|nr:hypothetical protein [candidate division WOR-3 bacterium]
MKLYRILLKPKGIIEKIPSSETIFGALCWGIRIVYSEEELITLLNNFKDSSKKFIPSSAFPLLKFKNNNGCLYCYPNLILPDPSSKEMINLAQRYTPKISNNIDEIQYSKRLIISEYKKFKEIKYLSETLFKRLVNGEKIIKLYEEYLNERLKIIEGILLASEDFDKIENEKLMEKRTLLRNKIDRLSFSTVPSGDVYYEEVVYLNSEILQLYFLLLTDDINFFIPIFRWLSDTGIGGNRTVGKGYYEIEVKEEVNLFQNVDSNIFISLSKYLPEEGEIDWRSENNYYKLLSYQPRVDTMFFKGGEFIKNRITYFSEGSILQAKEKKEYYGKLYPSAEFQGKIIYQSGFTIPVFIKRRENEN